LLTFVRNVIWLADTNYRIDLENETARALVTKGDLDELVASDQLKRAIDSQAAFLGYEEGPLLFPPTYRYDVNSDDYDTSEKMRIPAWTDRVLYRGQSLDLSAYSRAELRGSDHRPVFAIFRAEIRVVDILKKAALRKQLLESVIATAPAEKREVKLHAAPFHSNNASDDEQDDLPLPSSDEHAWWDGPGHSEGVFHMSLPRATPKTGNPFDSANNSLSSSPSSSDDELYSHAQNLQAPLTPVKPHLPPRPPLITKPAILLSEEPSHN